MLASSHKSLVITTIILLSRTLQKSLYFRHTADNFRMSEVRRWAVATRQMQRMREEEEVRRAKVAKVEASYTRLVSDRRQTYGITSMRQLITLGLKRSTVRRMLKLKSLQVFRA